MIWTSFAQVSVFATTLAWNCQGAVTGEEESSLRGRGGVQFNHDVSQPRSLAYTPAPGQPAVPLCASCEGKKAALIYDESPADDYDTYLFETDMDFVFGPGQWTGFVLSEGGPREEDLLDCDVIVVEGGGPLWTTVAPWLNEGGSEMLQSLANQGKGIFINAGPFAWIEASMPLGGKMVLSKGSRIGELTPALSSGDANPLSTGPYLPVADRYNEDFHRAEIVEDFPDQYETLITDWGHSGAVAVGGYSATGSHVLYSGTTHNIYWKVADETTLNSVEAVNLRLNMFHYVCRPEYYMVRASVSDGGRSSECLEIDGEGHVTVAFHGSDAFNVSLIDGSSPSSLKFNGLDVKDVAQCFYEDIDSDSFVDYVCAFVDDLGKWQSFEGDSATVSIHAKTYCNSRVMSEVDICLTPTLSPTTNPTLSPTTNPTKSPTTNPTKSPTTDPTKSPTSVPTFGPTSSPTDLPTAHPTSEPTSSPSVHPSAAPSSEPSSTPSASPSSSPSSTPSATPSSAPSSSPSSVPSSAPSATPSSAPTAVPSTVPSSPPSAIPTLQPTCSDKDGDGMCDAVDSCPNVYNANDPDGTACAKRAPGAPNFVCSVSEYEIESIVDLTASDIHNQDGKEVLPADSVPISTLECTIDSSDVRGRRGLNGVTGHELYAYDKGYHASFNGPFAVRGNEVTLSFLKASDGLYFFVVLDAPKSGGDQDLLVTITKHNDPTPFGALVKDDTKNYIDVSEDGRTVIGSFHWHECCSDGLAVTGFEDDVFELDVEFSYNPGVYSSTIRRVYLQSASQPRTLVSPSDPVTGDPIDLDFSLPGASHAFRLKGRRRP